jgi:hypothetical protein
MGSDVLQAIISGKRAAERSSEAVHRDRLLVI